MFKKYYICVKKEIAATISNYNEKGIIFICTYLLYLFREKYTNSYTKEGNSYMKMEKVTKDIINSNKELFSKNELKIINNNIEITKKIFLLGILSGREIYGNNLQ